MNMINWDTEHDQLGSLNEKVGLNYESMWDHKYDQVGS